MTPAVTAAGGATGLVGVSASGAALAALLTDPDELAGLYNAATHRTMTPAVFKLAGVALALAGSGAIALVSALLHPSPIHQPAGPTGERNCSMSPFVKAILDATVKPFADREIAALKANQAANVAAIEAEIGTGGNFVGATLSTLIAGIKANPFVTAAIDVLAPTLTAELTAALGAGAQDVPSLYAAGLAFLEKEDAYL